MRESLCYQCFMTTANEHQQHAKTLRRFQRRITSMMTAKAIIAAMFPADRSKITAALNTAAEYHENAADFLTKREPTEDQEGNGIG